RKGRQLPRRRSLRGRHDARARGAARPFGPGGAFAARHGAFPGAARRPLRDGPHGRQRGRLGLRDPVEARNPATAALVAALSLGVAAEAAPPETARYEIDAAQSTIAWELPATLHTVHGKVPELSGFVDIETASSGGRSARGRVVVRAAAMTTGNDSR